MKETQVITVLLEGLGALCLIVTLPLVLELLAVTSSFLLAPRRHRSGIGLVPRLTVIVPAHNEEGSIQDCVKSLSNSAKGAARVLVVAHNCSDGTTYRAAQAGSEVLVYNDSDAGGKGQALRYGFNRALKDGAEAVLVVDADSVVSANLIPEVLRSLSDGATAVQCRYEMLSADKTTRGNLASLAFRAFTYIRCAGRDRLGLSVGISGNGFALTAKLLEKVPYDAFSIVEDLEYHIQMIMAGESVRFIESATVSSWFPPSSAGEASQQSRWQGGRLGVARKWLVPLIGQVARGNFRLVEPVLDLAGLPMAFGVTALAGGLLVPLHWLHVYVAVSLSVVFVHVMAAAWAGPDLAGTLGHLAMAPFFILWKLRLIPKLLSASSRRAAWIRTDRGTKVPTQLGQDSV